MATELTYDVFLSHNSSDKPRVRRLAERLRDAGLRVWFDEWVIKPGDDIYLAIERGLEASRVQVLCLSSAALGSDWVSLERSTVLFRDPTNVGRRFIPLLLDHCTLPDALRRYRYIDYRRVTKAAFADLLTACQLERHGEQQPRLHDASYDRPEDPRTADVLETVKSHLSRPRTTTFMGILDTASEVELIISLALTNPELIGIRDGVLVPITSEARVAVGTFTNPVDDQAYYYEVSPLGLEKWVNDAEASHRRRPGGSLPYTILKLLKEQRASLVFPERDSWGLLLDIERIINTLDEIRDLIVQEHKLLWKVVPRLTIGGSGRLHLAEPNVAIRLSRREARAGYEQPVGRKAIEGIAHLVRAALLQDSVAIRARTAGGDWQFVLLPGSQEEPVEVQEPWEEAPIRLRYRYSVLPPELLPWFILRTHELSDRVPYWRPGVVLRHGEASALIRPNWESSELRVFVLGGDEDTRRVLVTMVRRELVALHGEMKITPVEELELTGDLERWIGVNTLHGIENPGAPKLRLPVSSEGTAEVNLPRELDKLEPAESRLIGRDPKAALLPVRVFVGYAYDNERLLQRLDAMLGVLEQHHQLVAWEDMRMVAGKEWDAEIRQRLEEMDIFLFIASQLSLVRPYLRDPEIKRALERWEAGEVEIVTVKLEPCGSDDDPDLGKFQRLAARYGSIVETNPRSVAWEQVRKDLLPVIERVREKKSAATRNAVLAETKRLQAPYTPEMIVDRARLDQPNGGS